MFVIKYDKKDGSIRSITFNGNAEKDDLMVEELPSHPQDEGVFFELKVVNGELKHIPHKADEMTQEPEPTEPVPEPTEPIPPTREEVEAMRQEAYRVRVDPITCEISRLRDMGGTEDEIAEAMARREREVARIKAEMPYNE